MKDEWLDQFRPNTGWLVTFDLDSTLADTRHRHHMINPDRVSTDWTAYSMACYNDIAVEPVVRLALALSATNELWIVSGRDAAARSLTEEWLDGIGVKPSGILLNDHSGNYKTHEEYKVAMVREAERRSGLPHLLHVDDWPPIAPAMRRAGYQTVIVTPPHVVDEWETDGHLTYV